MNHEGVICAAVPLTTVAAAAHYCHGHMTWEIDIMIYRQTSDASLEIVTSKFVSLGPFDDVGILVEEFAAALDTATQLVS
jgi:hypothetical protein